MIESLELPYVQRGLWMVVALAVGAGVLGTWVVLRGLAFYAHAVGTAAFPGLVLADGLAFSPFLGAAGTAALVAGLVALTARRGDDGPDTATALVLVGALAAGVILASDVFASRGAVDQLLFGSLLLVEWRDVWLVAALGVLALLASLALGPRWLTTGFDAPTARMHGLRGGRTDAVLLGLVAAIAVASLDAIGALLVTAMLVVPAATTRLLCRRLRTWQIATVALAAVEGVAGLLVSVELNAPPGATIAVIAGAVFALVALAPRRRLVAAAGVAAVVASGCGSESGAGGDRPVVAATTTQVADLARAVAGDQVEIAGLLAPNSDPHDYEPRPDDVKAVARAQVVLASGLGLDELAEEVVDGAGSGARIVELGDGVPHQVRVAGEDDHGGRDPHWWHDLRNVEAAVTAIRDELVELAPGARTALERNAAAYVARTRSLDRAISACLRDVPAAKRKLVTEHDALGHFAARYGFEVVGAVIPATTTQAQPSAGELSRLSRTIRREKVRAVFPESSLNPRLARAIARQTGATADRTLYADTLGPRGSAGATLLSATAHNAAAIAAGVTGGEVMCELPS